MDDKKEQCKKVLPGEQVATSEEYTPGFGTYEHDGLIYASAVGDLNLDEKSKTARLKFDNPPMTVFDGDKVFCEVTDVRTAMVICNVLAIDGVKRAVTGETDATIHVSRIANKYVEDASQEYRQTDLLRAEVIQSKPSIQLSTVNPHLGVILAKCRVCREPMVREQGNKLYCPKCERTEYRKVADDYRDIQF